MLWIWLIARNSHKWGTGPLDRYFAFICARCGVTTPAMVRAFGFGSGSSIWAAQQKAHASADAFAYRATSACACPNCSELQPQIIDQFATAASKVDRRRKLRIPVAVALTFLVFALLAIPAVRDLHHSVTLIAVAVSAAAAVGALAFAILTAPVMTPGTNPAGVWFSRDPSMGPASWFQAQPGRAPFVAQPASILRALSFVTMGVTAVSALVALIMWTETFRKVYVVSSEGTRGDLEIKIDGKNVGKVLASSSSGDAPNESFEVRTDSSHHVIVTGADGHEAAYDLDPDTASHGWVLAPHGRQRGLCLASIKWYYGTKPKEGDDTLLGKGEDLVELPHSYDYVFTTPPSTIQTQNGSSETRTSLRALDCASLDNEKVVPFRDAPRR